MNGQVDFIVTEDGSLELGDSIKNIVFHQDLNVFLVTTNLNAIRVFDPHSLKLADVPLAKYVPDPGGTIQCMYHGKTGAVVCCGGKSLGIRRDHQGVLLLHTILQTQVTSHEPSQRFNEIITLEILLCEALQLQKVFWEVNNIENANEVKEALAQAIAEPFLQPCSNPKVGKWSTVCLTLPYGTLRSVCASLVSELRNLGYFIPAHSLTSALFHRLNHLSPALATDGAVIDKEAMFSEVARLATFNKWPHMNYKWALPDQMAQAGFYHQPVASGDDRALCFICNVCLVYWEPTDEPWSEHERHSPNCPYVKGGYTTNVPLSITHATSPAVIHSERGERIHRISTSNSKMFIASATANGNIVVWNISKQLKKEISFLVDPSDSTILDKHFSDTIGYTDVPLHIPKEAWAPSAAEALDHDSPPGEGKNHSATTNPSSATPVPPPPPSDQKETQKEHSEESAVASNDPLSSLVSLYEETELDFTGNDAGKEFEDASDTLPPLSHLINISDIVDDSITTSPTTEGHKLSNAGNHHSLTGPKSVSPIQMNDIDCIDWTMEDVLQLENLLGCSMMEGTAILTNKSGSTNAVTLLNGSAGTPTPELTSSNSGNLILDDVSDELFVPPRPSHDVRVSSLCIFTDPSLMSSSSTVGSAASSNPSSKKSHRACLAVGVGLRRYDLFASTASSDGLVQVLNNANQSSHNENKPPLDIMKLENLLDDQPEGDTCLPEADDSTTTTPNSFTSFQKVLNNNNNNNGSSPTPKNFVPYLLVYDLSHLAQSPALPPKQTSNSGHQGTSKKSTRKAVPSSSSLSKVMKAEVPFVDMCSKFPPNKTKTANNKNTTNGGSRGTASPHMKKVPKCAQCLPSLPYKLNKLKLQLFVDLILISPCGQYLLVSLQQFQNKQTNHPYPEELQASASAPPQGEQGNVVGGFILYQICSSDEALFLQEKPVSTYLINNWNLVAKEIVMIPNMVNDGDNVVGGLAGVICMDGCLRMLSLAPLEYVQEVVPQDKKFNSITYCHSLERLCVTKDDGKVSLLHVKGDEDSSDDPETIVGEDGDSSHHSATLDSKSDNSIDKEMKLQSHESLTNKPLTEETLNKCLELTQFQAGCPRFVATVPPCWAEVIQAQKKRRNPQHLQHQSEEIDCARTWRLERDRSTFDEHMLDILLPLPNGPGGVPTTQIGHVDVKLNFSDGGNQPLPKIQITLLKQNLKTRKTTLPKDIDSLLEFPENPVLTKDFLLTHKAEILCGPVTVNQFIDLTGQAANLTLTSPDLFACKGRSFLIHLKAIKPNESDDKEKEASCSLDLLPQYVPPQSTTFDKLSSMSAWTKRGEAPKGCNVIQDLTLTVHCCAKTNIPQERLQRMAMIEKVSFHSELIAIITNPSSSQHSMHRALDVLLWILCIHTASELPSSRRRELLALIQGSLTPFIRTCIIGGDRSLAHKLTKIILTALESLGDTDRRHDFGEAVLEALLNSLERLLKCKSAGAVYWFFSLLNHVKWCNPAATTDKATELLSLMSEVLSRKMHPLHSILQTNFGLYGMPFERDLFDTFPPLLMKQTTSSSQNPQTSNLPSHPNHHHTTTTNGNNNVLNNHHDSGSWNKYDCPNIFWAGSHTSLKSPLGGGEENDLGIILGQNGVTLGMTPQIGGLCGLFEVEPLHFSLHMASDGTKMERVFPGSSYSANAYIVQPTSNTETDSSLSLDSSKTVPVSMPPVQLHKAVEDMEHMVMKNQAVALLLSKKAKKSYLEKLKETAKLKAQKILSLSALAASLAGNGIPNGEAEATSKELDNHVKDPPTNNSTPSSLSSDASPEGVPGAGLIEKPPAILSNDILGNIVEGVASTLFGSSMLNSSLNLLANVTNDIPPDPVIDNMLSIEAITQGMTVDKVIDMLNSVEEDQQLPPDTQQEKDQDEIEKEQDEIENMMVNSLMPLCQSSPLPGGKNNKTDSPGENELPKSVEGESSSSFPLQETDKMKLEKSSLENSSSLPIETPYDPSANVKFNKEGGSSSATTVGTTETPKTGSLPTGGGLPYQQLLSIPPQQMIVIERMHSGARRFVILDFGAPVVLTDVIIPACSDLVSLTIDIWLSGEETDGERLAVASDIGLRPLILADLQPPPLCRFLKVTTLGRYGMGTSQCRIPVGAFYGHTIILPWYLQQPSFQQVNVITKKMAKMQLSILSNMVEDVSCRYSLACSKLKTLLQPHCKASSGGMSHLLGPSPYSGTGNLSANAIQEKKIVMSYQECLTEQQHLNLILAVMRRLQKFIGLNLTRDLSNPNTYHHHHSHHHHHHHHHSSSTIATSAAVDYRKELEACSADQLSTLVQSLLNCLLTLTFPPPTNTVQLKLLSWCGPAQAKAMIENVCIRGPKGAQVAVVSLLARLCSNQPWWGEFLASTLVSLFSTGESNHFPATRIFALLTFLGQRSVQCGRGTHVIDAVLESLLNQLRKGGLTYPSPMDESRSRDPGSPQGGEYSWFFGAAQCQVDPKLISWLLLFLSLCLDLVATPKGTEGEKGKEGGRWSWLMAESSLQKKGSDSAKGTPKASRELLRRRLVHHKQQLVNLETASKSFGEVLAGLGNVINPEMYKQSEQVFKTIQKQHAMKHYKDLCSIQRNETNSLRKLCRNNPNMGSANATKTNKDDAPSGNSETIAPVDRVCCLSVTKALVNMLTNTQHPCSVDTFLLACKVIGGLGKVTRPSLKVSEFLNEEQLVTLLTHSMTLDSMWGSPWAIHALTCLLQDVLEGESLYGWIVLNVKPKPKPTPCSETNVTDNNKEVYCSTSTTSSTAQNDEPLGVARLVQHPNPTDSSSSSSTTGANGFASAASAQTDTGVALLPPLQEEVPSGTVPSSTESTNSTTTEDSSHPMSSMGESTDNSSTFSEQPLLSILLSLSNTQDTQTPPTQDTQTPPTTTDTPTTIEALPSTEEEEGLSASLETPPKVENEDENKDILSVTTSSALTYDCRADQSATAISPPTVNVATSHFAPIEEEEGPGKYIFMVPVSDESSASDDMIEFLSEFQSDLNSLPVSSSTGFKYLPTFDSYSLPPNPIYSSSGPQKYEDKDSRVGDLLSAPLAPQKGKVGTDHSTAVDARLENGVSLTAELRIHMMNAIHASRLCSAVSAPLQMAQSNYEEGEVYRGGNMKESVELLSLVFQSTLSQMSFKFEGNQLESILELWLNLNLDMAGGEYNSTICPYIPLYPNSISALLSAVARAQNISVRCWCLVLQTLTLCSSLNPPLNPLEQSNTNLLGPDLVSPFDLSWMSQAITSDRNFIPVMQKLLSGHYPGGDLVRCNAVGNTLTNLLEDLLVRLEVRCDVMSAESVPGNALKMALLKLVMRLLEPDGPLARGHGPLDVQKSLLSVMLSMHYNGLPKTHIPLTIINSIASVVNGFLCSEQEVVPGTSEQSSSLLGGLFASVLGADGQQGPVPTRRVILCSLLNLAKKLVELPLEPVTKGPSTSSSNGATGNLHHLHIHPSLPLTVDHSYHQYCLTDSLKLEQRQLSLSQTDEHKASMNPATSPAHEDEARAASGNSRSPPDPLRGRVHLPPTPMRRQCCHNLPNKTLCIADSVLQNNETMQLLLHSLRCCEGTSTVPMNLIGLVSGDVTETLGIGKTLLDALYQLLLTLNQKSSDSDLLLMAVLRYIRPNFMMCQPVFSETLFCFFTQVLDCENLLAKFAAMNGTELIWDNLVRSVGAFGGPRTALISSVMNHLNPPLPQSTMSATSHTRIDPTTGSPSTVESSNPRGLFNFAPLAVVTSSNPTARPADALVKSQQFFQRTKSPPWSYHFYPEENWLDLNLTLPCPILLHEIQLQPHTISLGMGPSGISVESGCERGCLIPLTGLVCTAGLTCINITLRHPVVASIIVLRLHRPRDQSTLGLSHLKLLGTTTFKNKSSPKDTIWEQGPQKSSYWWLGLVNHCMFNVPGGFNLMLESGARVNGVMESMVTLLAATSTQPNTPPSSITVDNTPESLATSGTNPFVHTFSSGLIANTTLALVNFNQDMLHTLVKCLFNHPLMLQPSGSSSVDAAIALLCGVSTTPEGVTLLVDWFTKMVEHQTGLHDDQPSNPSGERSAPEDEATLSTVNPEILHCFAAILWNMSEDMASLVTETLFRKVYTWCENATGAVKEGLDYIICSLCKVQPNLFTQLLLYMGFLTVIDSTSTSITDDRKDREAEIRAACTDDMKESGEEYGLSGEGRLILQDPSIISITPHHLQTIALAAQSPSAIHLMLDSGFPLLLVHGILEWCKAELLHQVESCTTPNMSESATDLEKANIVGGPQGATDLGAGTPPPPPTGVHDVPIHDALPPLSTPMVVHTLETLAAMCTEMPMKDWLGSGEGSVFWIPLLNVLGDPVMHGSEMSVRVGCDANYGDYSRVEDATIRLMKDCCNNHDHNQKLLAAMLCHLIQRQNTPPPGGLTYLHSLSGFTRRLVLQILLETECVLVQVTANFCLSQPPLHTIPPHSRHPRYGAGNKTRLMYLPVSTRVEEVVKMVTDWWRQTPAQTTPVMNGDTGLNSNNNNDLETCSYKKEIREAGLELVDKLSLAAGVTAKDKRMKDKGHPIKGPTKARKKEPSSQCKKESSSDSHLFGHDIARTYGLIHEELLGGGSVIPPSLTLAQVLAALWHHGTTDLSQLKFGVVFSKDSYQEPLDSPAVQSLLKTDPRPSMLSVFSSQGGLSILAQHMALLYPDTSHQFMAAFTSKNKKREDFDKLLNTYLYGNSLSGSPGLVRNNAMGLFGSVPIPPHALGAFTLFLRLPGYAETLLKDNVKACCLLRSALGVYDGIYEGENSSFVGSLATLPFQVLEVLLKSTPLTTDDGLMLRRMCLSTGVLHLILACLSALSHQDSPDVITSLQHPNVPIGLVVATARASCPQRQNGSATRNDNDRCHYWAKGTGFGTGSTNQSWNVDQALIKQKLEEQHVVWLIKLLAQYINPGDYLSEDLQTLCKEELEKVKISTTKDSSAAGSGLAAACPSYFLPSASSSSSSSASTTEHHNIAQSSSQQEETEPTLPPEIYDLFSKAGLVAKISSYLSNDSVLDMSRHVPLYQALMLLVRAIAVTPSLSPLFVARTTTTTTISTKPASNNQETENATTFPPPTITTSHPTTASLPSLLTKMKTTVNTYITKLKWKSGKIAPPTVRPRRNTNTFTYAVNVNDDEKPMEGSDLQTVPEEVENEDVGLTLLVPDIQLSTKVVEIVMERLSTKEADERKAKENAGRAEHDIQMSQVDIYLNNMKPLQFDSYEMIVEDSERGIRFMVPYHYESQVRNAGETFNPRRMKRLAQEAVTLSTSLPLSYSSSVFVRTDVDRLDVMKVLITGPEDTPYANGCFEFDVYFSNNYPSSPLYINLQTTGEKRVRFNPNLYQDGKVCLSILNTWHGRPEEKWNLQTSTLLQVLVSIQSLILVPEPYFNEPGYEKSRGSPAALHNSQEYDANIKAATVRWAILNQLRNPSPCFKEVIEKHFWLKQKDILAQIEGWINELETLSKNKRVGRVIPHHAVAIKRLYQLLADDLAKMAPPKGLENVTVSPSVAGVATLLGAQSSSAVSSGDESNSNNGPVGRLRERKEARASLLVGKMKFPIVREAGKKIDPSTPTPPCPSGESNSGLGGSASTSEISTSSDQGHSNSAGPLAEPDDGCNLYQNMGDTNNSDVPSDNTPQVTIASEISHNVSCTSSTGGTEYSSGSGALPDADQLTSSSKDNFSSPDDSDHQNIT